MVYTVILIDLDDTLFDFTGSTRLSLLALFETIKLPQPAQALSDFFRINDRLWQSFERGELPKHAIYAERFRLLLAQHGRSDDPVAMNAAYRAGLLTHMLLLPDARALLARLAPVCELYAVTNGETALQKKRMDLSRLEPFFSGIFISEEMNCRKPEATFFDQVFAQIGPEKRSRAIIFGDSLSSDMQGGRNACIATCLFGPREKADARCDYVAEQLLDFPALIGL